MSRKPKLCYHCQIEKMKELGITFNQMNELEAEKTLMENTYFFKLGVFRKNFPKDANGKYDIEFVALSDLATLDMRLRYIFIHLCLDIEHSLKTKIIKQITLDPNEDGYKVIEDFINTSKGDLNRIFENVMDRNGNIEPPFQKYYDDPPFWIAIDFMSYGQFASFVEFYSDRINNEDFKLAGKYIKFVKNIRNKCAHSSPIMINLKPNNKLFINKKLLSAEKSQGLFLRHLKTLLIIDMLAVLELHKKFCSDGIK